MNQCVQGGTRELDVGRCSRVKSQKLDERGSPSSVGRRRSSSGEGGGRERERQSKDSRRAYNCARDEEDRAKHFRRPVVEYIYIYNAYIYIYIYINICVDIYV